MYNVHPYFYINILVKKSACYSQNFKVYDTNAWMLGKVETSLVLKCLLEPTLAESDELRMSLYSGCVCVVSGSTFVCCSLEKQTLD